MWETKQLLVLSDLHMLYVNLGLGNIIFFVWLAVYGMYISVFCIWIKQIKWI